MPTPKTTRTRNDEALNTGMSSALERRRLQIQEEMHNKRKAAKEAEKARLNGLSTQGDVVVEWIDKELEEVGDMRKMVTEFDMDAFMKKIPLARRLNVTSPEMLQAQTIAHLMHIEFLEKLKTRAKNTMKEAKRQDEASSFGEDE